MNQRYGMQGTRFSRRQFIGGVGTAALAYGLGYRNAAGQDISSPAIDVHCHVFNAHDLPVRGFVQRVVFGDAEDTVILDPSPEASRALGPWLGALLVEVLLTGGAPSAERELRSIEGAPAAFASARGAERDEQDARDLAAALRTVLAFGVENAFSNAPEFGDRASVLGGRYFVDRILSESGVQGQADLTAPGTELPYDEIARGLLLGDGPIARHLQWARLLNRDRRTIVDRLVGLYGGADRIGLFTPALIDFSQWLDDEPRSGLESQILVMERIQRLQGGPLVQCFAAFDPWRQVVDVEAGRSASALELVKWAVNDMGFIGVKLYPPMGFLPAGNQGSALDYPTRAEAIPDFTARLDAALDDLFTWAAAEGVPVMAHANDSNEAADGFGERASPRAWAPVLQKYPDLRLNLGHFGGFDESRDGGAREDWEVAIGDLVASGADNLYADASYLTEFLPKAVDASDLARVTTAWRQFIDQYDPDLDHVMFGSDWLMLGREAAHDQYFDAAGSFMDSIGATPEQTSRFLGGNAARFLGLRPNEPNRLRLEAYYGKHGLDADRLTRFDAA